MPRHPIGSASPPLRCLRLLLAMVLVASGLVLAPAQTAVACACGGIATDPGSTAKVFDEAAVIVYDGRTERIDMTLTMTGDDATSAAWLMPAPAGTRLSLGATGVMARLDALAAPKVVRRTKLRLVAGLGGSADSSAVSAGAPGVTVESRQRIGPFQVTTLSGTRADAVDDWLSAHGFATRADLLPIFQSYLDRSWRINAVKLVPDGSRTLDRTLPPLRMTFPAERAVYPMKLSSAATVDQRVRIHMLSTDRMEIGTQAAPGMPLRLDYAGETEPAVAGLDKGLAKDGRVWLTSWSGRLAPHAITGDYDFRIARTDEGYRREVQETRYIDIPVLSILLAAVGLLIVVGLALLLVRQSSRAGRG